MNITVIFFSVLIPYHILSLLNALKIREEIMGVHMNIQHRKIFLIGNVQN